ncbi:MAG: hypothetical protein ABIG89_06475 [Candidatus Woesearchaeota archaeon]
MFGINELKQFRQRYLDGDLSSDWSKPMFHLRNKITSSDQLLKLYHDDFFRDIDIEVIEDAVKKGYVLEIMPLTLLLGLENKDLLSKFLPKADFFERKRSEIEKDDPYGIFGKDQKIYVNEKGKKVEKDGGLCWLTEI